MRLIPKLFPFKVGIGRQACAANGIPRAMASLFGCIFFVYTLFAHCYHYRAIHNECELPQLQAYNFRPEQWNSFASKICIKKAFLKRQTNNNNDNNNPTLKNRDLVLVLNCTLANGHNLQFIQNRVLENDLVVGCCVRCINILAKLKWFQCER